MKSHISATIDESVLAELDEYAREERRTRSQTIELAVSRLLRDRLEKRALPTSNGCFGGTFDRASSYGDRI